MHASRVALNFDSWYGMKPTYSMVELFATKKPVFCVSRFSNSWTTSAAGVLPLSMWSCIAWPCSSVSSAQYRLFIMSSGTLTFSRRVAILLAISSSSLAPSARFAPSLLLLLAPAPIIIKMNLKTVPLKGYL